MEIASVTAQRLTRFLTPNTRVITAALIIAEYTNMYTEILANDTSSDELKKLKDRLSLLSKKKSKLLEYNIAGQINDRDFVEMNNNICPVRTMKFSRKRRNVSGHKTTVTYAFSITV